MSRYVAHNIYRPPFHASSAPAAKTATSGNGNVSAQTIVFQVAGQSNCIFGGSKSVLDPNVDYTDPRILMLGTNENSNGTINSTYLNRTVLGNPVLVNGDSTYDNVEGFSWGYFFARAYVQANPGSTVIMVCNAIAGTELDQWMPTGSPYVPVPGTYPYAIGNLATRAVQYCNSALSLYPGSVFGGTLWLQGESNSGYFPSNLWRISAPQEMANALSYLSSYFRNSIAGGANSPFIVGQMNSAWATLNGTYKVDQGGTYANDGTDVGTNNSILLNTLFSNIANYIPYSACALNTLAVAANGNNVDIHYGTNAHRAYGPVFYSAYTQALLNSSPSTPLFIISAPTSPTGNWLSAVNNNTTHPSLSWTSVPGAVEYHIYSPQSGFTLTTGTNYLTNSNVTFSGPLPSTPQNSGSGIYYMAQIPFTAGFNFTSGSHDFVVTPFNNFGSGLPSNTITLTYGSTEIMPSNVANLTTTHTTTSITATWAPVGSDVTVYDCYIRPTSVGGNYTITTTLPFSATAYTFVGLTPSTSYDIAILSFSKLGTSPGSLVTVVTTPPSTPPGAFTAAISGQTVTTTASSGAVTFSITAGPHTETGISPSLMSSGYTISTSLFGLTGGSTYNATISAVNGTGSTAASNNPISFVAAAAAVPFLTTYPGASAAYSMRQVNSGATSACIVTVSGTNTPVGFNSDGTLNLSSFTNSSYPLVSWTDQSVGGTNNIVVNGTATFYPNIGGKPYVLTSTSTLGTYANGSLTITCPSFFFMVATQASGYWITNALQLNGGPSSGQFFLNSTNVYVSTATYSGPNSTNNNGYFFQNETGSGTAYVNNTTPITMGQGVTGFFNGVTSTEWGYNTNAGPGSSSWVGQFQEYIVYPNDQTGKVTGIIGNVKTAWGV